MAVVNASKNHRRNNNGHHFASATSWIVKGLVLFAVAFVGWQVVLLEGMATSHGTSSSSSSAASGSDPYAEAQLRSERTNHQDPRPAQVAALFDETDWKERNRDVGKNTRPVQANACGYTNGLLDLEDDELHPQAGKRHMVTPPKGGKHTLVCCETTKGNLAMLVHHTWAPLGAKRFLDMVQAKYFDARVPMMRCIKNWLCQFGLNSDPELSKNFRESFPDDPPWLPQGKEHRQNSDGVKRFAKGYLAYAGAGPNTRGNQFIVALHDDGPLAGGSPWEVPWGELVGKDSYKTLSKIYTGYGEKGPPQGKLMNRGMDQKLRDEFPKIDFIEACVVVDEIDDIDRL